MVDDPVVPATSNNPLVTTLVTAVKVAGLVDTLNGLPAATVYAPGNDAFAAFQAKMGDEAFNPLLADNAGLTTPLSYHVVGTRYNAEQIVELGKTKQLAPVGATDHRRHRCCPDLRGFEQHPACHYAVRQHLHRERHRVCDRRRAPAGNLITPDAL